MKNYDYLHFRDNIMKEITDNSFDDFDIEEEYLNQLEDYLVRMEANL